MTLFASESVAIGHPDKVADQISDAILDQYLALDPKAHVDITTVVTHNQILLAGEISSQAKVAHELVARSVLKEIGYTDEALGIDAKRCEVTCNIIHQSPDIAQAVAHAATVGAGDQGIMIGYATDETEEFLPLPLVLAQRLMEQLAKLRPQLGPDGKTLVTVCYDKGIPSHIHSIVLSCQHRSDCSFESLQRQVQALIESTIPSIFMRDDTALFINPSGRFVIGGPAADTGITGRKQMVDTYGSLACHGGGAFSGKDPTKVDRSASYMARYIAKNIVAAKLAKRAQVTLLYVIGKADPLGISLETFGTEVVEREKILEMIPKIFDLSVAGIILELKLDRPIYYKTAFGGHFGRTDPDFLWEMPNKVDEIKKSIL